MKTLFTKSTIVLIAMGLIVAGITSAALVSYLSNEVETTNTVIDSPITLSVYGSQYTYHDNAWRTDWINLNKTVGDADKKLYGGSYYEVRMNRDVKANQNIKNYLEIVIKPSSGNLAEDDIDLTLLYESGSSYIIWDAFPCQTNFTYSNDGYYRAEIRDNIPGVTKFKIGIDLNQALDPSVTYKLYIQALDPDVVRTTSTVVDTCPW